MPEAARSDVSGLDGPLSAESMAAGRLYLRPKALMSGTRAPAPIAWGGAPPLAGDRGGLPPGEGGGGGGEVGASPN